MEWNVSMLIMQHNKASVILDSTEYIQGLKQKLEEMKQLPVPTTHSIIDYNPMPKVCIIIYKHEHHFYFKWHNRYR
jgi:tRNA uridine 5-carbamoylmethylation protein Kti12